MRKSRIIKLNCSKEMILRKLDYYKINTDDKTKDISPLCLVYGSKFKLSLIIKGMEGFLTMRGHTGKSTDSSFFFKGEVIDTDYGCKIVGRVVTEGLIKFGLFIFFLFMMYFVFFVGIIHMPIIIIGFGVPLYMSKRREIQINTLLDEIVCEFKYEN